jgi:acetyl-CoA carboxylase biotin carboxyl carrier protein
MAEKPKSGKKSKPEKKRGAGRRAKDGENATVSMVRELAAVVETHTLTELIVDLPDATITLRRGVDAALLHQQLAATPTIVQQIPAVAAPLAAAPAAAPDAASAADGGAPAEGANGEFHLITSPFVGTFYRRPNPDSTPYIEVGQRVEKGQVLCIVEAMKLMNEIEADIAGTVAAIIVDDADAVEYGQALFKISPA